MSWTRTPPLDPSIVPWTYDLTSGTDTTRVAIYKDDEGVRLAIFVPRTDCAVRLSFRLDDAMVTRLVDALTTIPGAEGTP